MRRVTLLLTIGAGLGLAAAAITVGTAMPPAGGSGHVVRASSQKTAATTVAIRRQQAANAYAKLPVSFVENRGQTDARARYYAQGNGYAFFLTPSSVVLSFAKQQAAPAEVQTPEQIALALQFVGRNPQVEPQGAERAAGVVNDLRGSDPSQWHTQIAQYRDVVYRELWPGIDLRLREQSGVLKYEFHVRPGASPADIQLAYGGADGLSVDDAGQLRISTPLGVLQDSAPVSYQDIDGVRVPVSSRYVLGGGANPDGKFSFGVGGYQRDHELVIDPGVQYTTFLGGNSNETGAGISVDAAGNAFVAGTTQSPNFPTTSGAFRRTGAAQSFPDVFVSKLNAAGTALIYSTFVGGSNMEFGNSLAVDANGNAYVTGTTKSSNFPTTGNAFDRSINIPPNCPRCGTDVTDGFAFKLNAAGSALSYSTYLGGTEYEAPRGIAVDGSGNAYVTGETLSRDFPTTAGAFSRTLRGDYDVFVTKLNPTGSALTYSTFLGGAAVDNGQQVQVDTGGNAYVLGFSSSTDFPTTAGAFDTTANGGFDATLTKLNPAGSALVYSTYLGGNDFDSGSGLVVDGAGSAYVTGGTPSPDWPVTPGAYDTTFSGGDGYVTKLNPAGSALVYSTFIGGSAYDSIGDAVLDPAGNAWLTGGTSSTDFPVTPGAPDTTFNGGAGDAVIAELNSTGSALLFATFLGGSQSEGGADIARDPTGDVYVVGSTYSQDFPATVGAFDRVWNGDLSIFWGDAFVTKIDIDAGTSTPPAPPGVPVAPTLTSPSNASSQPQPITFDWNDVPEAVSYTIQIDDSSAFSAPLVRDQSVTSSIYATTGLANATHFWRVRGVNSAGVVGAWSAVRSFTAEAPPPPAELSTLDLNPSTVVGGNGSSGTVIMTVGPASDAVISLSSSNPSVAGVPATTTVPANSFTGSFVVSTSAVSASTAVTITATYNGSSRTANLTVTPAGASAVSLQSVTASPSTVEGGSPTSAFVMLSAAAETDTTVALSSSNPAVVGVPASVTVATGTTARGFTVTTTSVTATTTATISATYNGTTRTATVTVNPAAPPPPPAQTAALTVSASGRSGERVVSSPAGINVATGSSGSASFTVGSSVTLSVTNGRDAIFSGACSTGGSKAKTCTFTLSGAASVTASVQ
jgi:hypothetical protein